MTSKFEGDPRMAVSISPPDGTRQLQGQLVASDVIAEAGLSAQPKAQPESPLTCRRQK
jgi:hypothetical protein